MTKIYPIKIINAMLGKDSSAKERAIRWIHKHLNDEVDPDLDFISDKVNATLEITKIAVDDKALKVIMRGLDLLEALSISELLECEYGFQVFARTLVEGDLVYLLACKTEDQQKKVREKCLEGLMNLAYNEKIGPNLVGD